MGFSSMFVRSLHQIVEKSSLNYNQESLVRVISTNDLLPIILYNIFYVE